MSATENTSLLERLKTLSEKHNKAIAALESIALAKLHIWNKQDLNALAVNALVALGEYQRANAPPNDQAQRRRVKESVRRKNAKQFFNDLIVSLTKNKRKWTPTERMQYNRVAAFLDA